MKVSGYVLLLYLRTASPPSFFRVADGNKRTIEADTVIPTSLLVPDAALADSLQERVAEVYTISDCREQNMIVHAIRDGWQAGNTI